MRKVVGKLRLANGVEITIVAVKGTEKGFVSQVAPDPSPILWGDPATIDDMPMPQPIRAEKIRGFYL